MDLHSGEVANHMPGDGCVLRAKGFAESCAAACGERARSFSSGFPQALVEGSSRAQRHPALRGARFCEYRRIRIHLLAAQHGEERHYFIIGFGGNGRRDHSHTLRAFRSVYVAGGTLVRSQRRTEAACMSADVVLRSSLYVDSCPRSASSAGSGLDLPDGSLRVCLDSRFLGATYYDFIRIGQSGIDRAYQRNRESRRVSRTGGHWTIADPNPFRHGPGLTGCTILLRSSRPDKPGAANAAVSACSKLMEWCGYLFSSTVGGGGSRELLPKTATSDDCPASNVTSRKPTFISSQL